MEQSFFFVTKHYSSYCLFTFAVYIAQPLRVAKRYILEVVYGCDPASCRRRIALLAIATYGSIYIDIVYMVSDDMRRSESMYSIVSALVQFG